CQLQAASPLVSRQHCALLCRDGKFILQDLGSKTGSFVNGQHVQGERDLQPDDHIKIGPLEFQIKLSGSEQAAAAPPEQSPPEVKPPPSKPKSRAQPPRDASLLAKAILKKMNGLPMG